MTTDQTLASIDGALEAWEHGPDVARWRADGGPDKLRPLLPITGLSINLSFDATPFVESLAKMSRALTAFVEPFRKMAHAGHASRHPRQHIRCRECNPAANPKPLTGWYKPGPKAARMRRRKP
jgi:hypothetical protein